MKPAIAVLVALLLATACSPQKKVTSPDAYNGRALKFGSGGGVTGSATTYTLLENGQLFSSTGVVTFNEKELTCIARKETRAFFKRAAAIAWPIDNVSHPGNLYYILEYRVSGKKHRATWGDNKYSPPSEVQKLYEDLNRVLINKKQ